uniref:F-box domain-containing protein n=1 Tax=Calcidiscus leptoporus TaxID=127549 RepID=A0A7S0J2P0_9EUKA|mmetsp:Transcript_34994/g.81935  ORF Transcript_34994/g.81935 Transcript_34994/m.81935 type:complete len:332 (+) Transcript_34994:128-1123(+)
MLSELPEVRVAGDGDEGGNSGKDQCAAPISKLCPDILALCLSFAAAADQYALNCARRVCVTWCAVATNEDLWCAAVHARWKLRARRSFGKYKYGERSWMDVYRAFHRINRLPSLSMISSREVVYAQGTAERVVCWLTVHHQPACRLADDAFSAYKHMYAKLVFQNLRAEPVAVCLRAPGCLMLSLRDGGVSTPKVVNDASLVDGGGLEALAGGACKWRERCAERLEASAQELQRSACVLQPLQCAVADVQLQADQKMNFEPELLEACRRLHVQLLASSAGGSCAAADSARLRSWQPLTVLCRFAAEEVVWRHYQQVNRDFYVHLDRDSDCK